MGRVIIWIGGIFATIGLVFVAVAGWRYLEDRSFAAAAVQRDRNGHPDGGQQRLGRHHLSGPVVSFRDAGGAEHIFGSGVSSSPPRYAAGDTVEVMYDPDSPDEAVIDSVLDRFFLALVFGGLGTVFSAIGGGILFYLFRKHQIAAQLRATGLPIQAKVLDCYLDTSLRVNGRNPWRVACEATHPATGSRRSSRARRCGSIPARTWPGSRCACWSIRRARTATSSTCPLVPREHDRLSGRACRTLAAIAGKKPRFGCGMILYLFG
jgi:hypothetical protein